MRGAQGAEPIPAVTVPEAGKDWVEPPLEP